METLPLSWEGGALLVLDQRALPAQERWLQCESALHVAGAIDSMAVRGAPAIGLAAAYGVALAPTGNERSGEEVRVAFEDAAALLAGTRPTAVNLRWALQRQREAVESALAAGDDPAVALVRGAQALEAEIAAANRTLSRIGAERFAPGDTALTHCNTGPLATGAYGTAAGVLRSAWESGRLVEVWVCETRPLLQGARLTAWELGRAGIPHRLVTDSSAASLLAGGLVSRVVVGADRIAANGDVANKVGTLGLAVLAHRWSVPFYVAAPVSTLDPATPDGASIPIEERDPSELTSIGGVSIAPEGAEALNLAFDVTPAELVSAIFTEAGALEPPYADAIADAVG